MPAKKHSAPTTLLKSKRLRASELTEETAESVTTPPQNLITVDVRALPTTLSLAVTQAITGTQAGQQSTHSGRYRERADRGIGTG